MKRKVSSVSLNKRIKNYQFSLLYHLKRKNAYPKSININVQPLKYWK